MRRPIRWTIYIDAFRDASPVYEGDLSIVTAKETGQAFFRSRLSGDITFVRSDFDYLLAECGMNDRVEVILEEFTGTWDALFHGFFYRADSVIDEDNRTWAVTPQPLDQYDKVVAALDREFDLVRLDVKRTPVTFLQQGLIQLYAPGSSFVNNYLSGVWWEQEIDIPTDPLNTFFTGTPFQVFAIAGDDSVLDPDISGQYLLDANPPYFGYTRTDGAYALTYDVGTSTWRIVDYATATVVYLADQSGPSNNPAPGFNCPRDNNAVLFESQTTASTARGMFFVMYGRILTNEATVDGNPTDPLPSPDISGEENYNYTRMYELSPNTFITASEHKTGSGKWGTFASDANHFANEYFVKPQAATGFLMPVNRSQWSEISLWFFIDSTLAQTLTDAATARTIRDAYKVDDVLSALLGEIDALVLHQENDTYSDFFYGFANPIRTIRNRLALTPKSNVLKGDYDKPAQRAPIKLSELLTLLRIAYRVHWHIDAGKMILEHVHYYEKGMTYTIPQVGADLTGLIEPKTGKNWGHRGRRYKYEKEAMPEGYRFAWMDQVSFPFSGYSLDILSPFIQRGTFEDNNVGQFTSDLAFALVQPGSISPDGFFLFDAEEGDGGLQVPSVEIVISDEEEYFLQNGHAAMVYLHDKYHRHNLPAEDIRLNGNVDTADTVRRAKLQEEEFPSPDGLNPMELVTTALGTGEVRETTLNISSRSLKINVAHDTE